MSAAKPHLEVVPDTRAPDDPERRLDDLLRDYDEDLDDEEGDDAA
jgi:hypothetical protein